MRILITGVCGFVGSSLALALRALPDRVSVTGVDNLSRPGAARNLSLLRAAGVEVSHGDIRVRSDVDALPDCDRVLDCAANASVLAGVGGPGSPRQLLEHNLLGTINLLEMCRERRSGFTLLSTSRVYSIARLSGLKVEAQDPATGGPLGCGGPWFTPSPGHPLPVGLTARGVSESFSTEAPVSLYGATKLASEQLALEYGEAFGFPVWINRCGVMAGPGQFGHPSQGIVAFWVHSFREGKPLRYLGFGGEGLQVRDALHPQDLIPLLLQQWAEPLSSSKPRVINLGGGLANAFSLRQLSDWCRIRYPEASVGPTGSPEERAFDIPWMVMDCSLAEQVWGWRPRTSLSLLVQEVAEFADHHPGWLNLVT